eukprot:gene6998-4962_t
MKRRKRENSISSVLSPDTLCAILLHSPLAIVKSSELFHCCCCCCCLFVCLFVCLFFICSEQRGSVFRTTVNKLRSCCFSLRSFFYAPACSYWVVNNVEILK